MSNENNANNTNMDSVFIEKVIAEFARKAEARPRTYHGTDLLAKEYKEAVLQIQQLANAAAEEYGVLPMFDVFCNLSDVDPASAGVRTITVDAPNARGKMDMYLFRPKDAAEDEVLPCVYLAHGGGYYAGTAMSEAIECQHISSELHVAVITYEYTLTKVAPFPAALYDAYAGLKYIYENAEELHVDKDKLILHGESGGGGVSSCLALYTKDKGEIPLRGQVLVYPQLDWRTGSENDPYKNKYAGEFIVNNEAIRLCWEKLLGGQDIPADQMRYVSPAVATPEQLKGLPPTFIIVGTLDCLVHEALNYANNLIQAGVSTELFVEPGVPHAYDMLGDEFVQKKRFFYLRDGFIKELLNQ